MKRWVDDKEGFRAFSYFNGIMVIYISEYLAIGPYILRSMRIQRMFTSRDIYYRTEVMPRMQIEKWTEKRIIKIYLIVLVFIFIAIGATYKFSFHLTSYNLLEQPLSDDGLFDKAAIEENYKEGIVEYMVILMITAFLLIYQLQVQWHIEKELSMFKELLAITFIWLVCG